MSLIDYQDMIRILRCPQSGAVLTLRDGRLESPDGEYMYEISSSGIALFAGEYCSADSLQQQRHYDRIAESYVTNLSYPHTQEYMDYLDRCIFEAVGDEELADMLEVCCGHGEGLALLEGRYRTGLGIDISDAMLKKAESRLSDGPVCFVQGDATRLPVCGGSFDSVVTLGGIHHVSDRCRLFREIFRVLRPGGRFVWREPLNDFVLWRVLREVIYRASPILDHRTEEPLRYDRTVPVLSDVGFTVERWRPAGFLGFCLFMNSDILVFNRLFRKIPGIRAVTRAAANFDEWMVKKTAFQKAGLQVIGVARKP